MLASALRSLVLSRCEGGDGLPARAVGPSSATLLEAPLDGGTATSLAWDSLGGRVLVAVAAGGGGLDRLRLLRAPGGSGPREEEVTLPAAVGASDVSVCCRPEAGATWAAVACTDGALRVVDASPGASSSVARTLYSHGVAATAVQLSSDGQCLASGSASGHVVVEPFSGHGGPSPLPSLGEGPEAAVTGLRFSPLRPETLAGCDVGGRLQVWDARLQKHLCKFPRAHDGAIRGLSFSMHNSDLLISGGDDSQLVFWDVSNGRQIREVAVETGLTSLSYHTGGYLLGAGTSDGSVFVFDLRMLVSKSQPALPVHRFEHHQARGGGGVKALAFAPYEPPPARASEAQLAMSTGAPAADAGSRAEPLSSGELSRSNSVVGAASVDSAGAGGPTTATLQSMMGRLSYRPSQSSGAAPQRSSSRSGTKGAEAQRGDAPAEAGREQPEVLEYSSSARGESLRSEPLLKAHGIKQLPTTPILQTEKPRRTVGGPPETPIGQIQGQASRFNISSTPREQAHLTSSPWWGAEPPTAVPEGCGPAAAPAGAAPAAEPAAGLSSAAVGEALRPLLAELREEILREVRESQCAQLEQTFRLHAELRRDIDELRAEVQQLRGELRVL